MNTTSKRAEYVALAGLLFSVFFYIVVGIFGFLTKSSAVGALSWLILAGGLVWLVLLFMFHLRSLADQEKLDMAQLAATEQGATIFQGGADREALLHIAKKRLEVFEKWFMPSFSILIAIYDILIGFWLFYKVKGDSFVLGEIAKPQLAAIFMVMVAFLSFLISRYATGMSSQKKWRLLRAGGSYLLAVSILSFALALSLGAAQFKIGVGLDILRWVGPLLLIVLGVEICLNTVLDIYRPRLKGQEVRVAFDSRLLGIINEPGGILHTFASAIDYQFGFKVSQTWFAQLVGRAFVPLLLFFVLVLNLLSCVVVVDPGEQALIQHLGTFNAESVVGPGIYFKLPWPFDVADVYATSRVEMIGIGYEKDAEHDDDKHLLWGEKHYGTEYNLLVATGSDLGIVAEGAVPVSIVNAAVSVKYHISDLYAYVRNTKEPQDRLKAICYSELSKYAASSKIETEGDVVGADKLSIIGAGRSVAGKELKKSIQARTDAANLGIEIIYVGLEGVHPPTEVAEAYQGVIGAVQQKQASILMAQGESRGELTLLCGSVEKAEELYAIATRLQVAKDIGDAIEIEAVSRELYDAVDNADGEMFKILAEARGYAFEQRLSAKAAGERFAGQVMAMQASPMIYKKQHRLEMLEEVLKNVRKYVVVAEENDSEVFIINLEEKLAPSLYDMEMDTIEQ